MCMYVYVCLFLYMSYNAKHSETVNNGSEKEDINQGHN